MKERHTVTLEQYDECFQQLREALEQEPGIVFAYLHGSFVQKHNFGDIDIAVYLHGEEEDFLMFELELENRLEQMVSYPVDVRVLNNAPAAFSYSVLKDGVKLLVRDDNVLADFMSKTCKMHFDFLPFRRRYLREALHRDAL